MRRIALIFILSFFASANAQIFDLVLLDDTILDGPADPMQPIIFHFEATNLTDSTYLVDFLRLEENIPSDWETALCTEACFPPDVSEGIFFLDEIATDEISFYFYPASVGSGSADLKIVNTVDTNNQFFYTLYANSVPLGIPENRTPLSFVLDYASNQILIEATSERPLLILDVNGKICASEKLLVGFNSIDISGFESGIYILNSGQWSSKIRVDLD